MGDLAAALAVVQKLQGRCSVTAEAAVHGTRKKGGEQGQ